MTIIKNGCICGGDYHTTTEQCDDADCKSERKIKMNKETNKDKVIRENNEIGVFYHIEGDD